MTPVLKGGAMSASRYTPAGMIAMMKVLHGQDKIDYAQKHADDVTFDSFKDLHDFMRCFDQIPGAETVSLSFLIAHKDRLSNAKFDDINLKGFIDIAMMTALHCSEVMPAFQGWLQHVQFDCLVTNLLGGLKKKFDSLPPEKDAQTLKTASYYFNAVLYHIAKACMHAVTDNEKLAKVMSMLSDNPEDSRSRFRYQKEVEQYWEGLDNKSALQQSRSFPGSPTMFARKDTDGSSGIVATQLEGCQAFVARK